MSDQRYGLPPALADVLDELVHVCGRLRGPCYVGQLQWRYPETLGGLSTAALRSRLARLEKEGAARSIQQAAGKGTLWEPTARGRAVVQESS